MKVLIIDDKVFPVENDTIDMTQEEYHKYIDSDEYPFTSGPMVGHSKTVRLYKLPYLSEYQPKTALEVEGAELYDLSDLSAGQIRNLLKSKNQL